MDKETLSNYGWIVICVLILTVMIALATPFGDFIASGVKSTTKGLFATSQKALNSTGLITIEENFYEEEINHYAKIPEGGVYYKGVGNTAEKDYTGYTEVLTEGDAFPTISTGDIYVYGDYEYRYQIAYCGTHSVFDECLPKLSERVSGWSAKYIGQSETPSIILRKINEKPITSLKQTFRNTNVVSAPSIPSTVTDMTGTFSHSNITESPHIPNGVKSLRETFSHTPIKVAPMIPTTVKTLYSTFSNCEELVDISKITIPQGVETTQNMFLNCKELTDASNIEIPSSVTDCSWMFIHCEKLEKIPVEIPSSVINANWMFGYCYSLKNGNIRLNEGLKNINYFMYNCFNLITAPEIPSTVQYASGTFECCKLLEQEIVVHANPTTIDGFLYATKVTKIVGNSTMKEELLETLYIPHNPDPTELLIILEE